MKSAGVDVVYILKKKNSNPKLHNILVIERLSTELATLPWIRNQFCYEKQIFELSSNSSGHWSGTTKASHFDKYYLYDCWVSVALARLASISLESIRFDSKSKNLSWKFDHILIQSFKTSVNICQHLSNRQILFI